MFCLKCGAKVPQGMKQCLKCGAPIEDEYCGGFWGLVGENRTEKNAGNDGIRQRDTRQVEIPYAVPGQNVSALDPESGNEFTEKEVEKEDAMKHTGIVWGLIGVCAGMLILLGIMLFQVNRLNGRIRALSDSVETLSQRDGTSIAELGKDVNELKTSLAELQDEVMNSSASGIIGTDDKMEDNSSEVEESASKEKDEPEETEEPDAAAATVDIAEMMESVTAIQREMISLENGIPSGSFDEEEEFLNRIRRMRDQIGVLRENIREVESWMENLGVSPENVQNNLEEILEKLQALNEVDLVYFPGSLMDSRLSEIEDILGQEDMRLLDGAEDLEFTEDKTE